MHPGQGTPISPPADFHRTCLTHAAGWRIDCDEFDAIYARANYACELCGSDKRLGIDHEHRLGIDGIRGVLCPKCNGGHMRRVDSGERPVAGPTLTYLLRSWHATKDGGTLGYDPAPHVSVNGLSQTDRETLRTFNEKNPGAFEHPGLAACVAHGDLRPVWRLGFMVFWKRLDVDIADPDGPTSLMTALGRRF